MFSGSFRSLLENHLYIKPSPTAHSHSLLLVISLKVVDGHFHCIIQMIHCEELSLDLKSGLQTLPFHVVSSFWQAYDFFFIVIAAVVVTVVAPAVVAAVVVVAVTEGKKLRWGLLGS